MAKLTLTDLVTLENETSVVTSINNNNAAIEAALELTLTRTGTAPNEMAASLDMNSNRILNLPAPASAGEPLRLADADPTTINAQVAAATAAKVAAEAARDAAITAKTNAETAETNAELAETNAETAETNAEAAQAATALLLANAQAGYKYQWDTGFADANPGNGFVRCNSGAAWNTAFRFNISKTDANGSSLANTIATWDDSTTNIKGTLVIRSTADPTKFVTAHIDSALLDGTTYWYLPVTVLNAGPTPAQNEFVSVQFFRTGDTGSGGTTNLGYTAAPTNGTVTSSTGASATVPLATTTNAGLMAPAQVSTVAEHLTAARTYFVRTDGSDSNTGLADNAGGAFLTIQKAIDVASSLDLGPFNVTITVRAGTYNQALTLKRFRASTGTITITGASDVTITSSGGTIVANGYVTNYIISGGLNLASASSGAYVVQLLNYSNISIGTVNFTSSAFAHVGVLQFSTVQLLSPYTISSGASHHLYIDNGSKASLGGQTVTVTGNPTISLFVRAGLHSRVESFVTWSGTSVGTRHSADYNSIIQSTNDFPGTVAGTATNGSFKI